ncbi:MAG: hypothetical protein BWK79_11190 [Beggiatoa sp. IS2]|nr:MAG: hypothetical protein BWK79_11190 [Beggiatoa sp. IS2]
MSSNLAVHRVMPAMVTATVGVVPVQLPSQPLKTESAAGVAVKLAEVPFSKNISHVGWQLIPAGLLTTVPLPFN